MVWLILSHLSYGEANIITFTSSENSKMFAHLFTQLKNDLFVHISHISHTWLKMTIKYSMI